MMLIKIRIKKIDGYGFTGRDHHPTVADDEGHEAVVTNVDFVPDDDVESPTINFGGQLRYGYQVFHAITDTGRTIELMGHEIELVSCTHDGDV